MLPWGLETIEWSPEDPLSHISSRAKQGMTPVRVLLLPSFFLFYLFIFTVL
jgi:hypothetical protein